MSQKTLYSPRTPPSLQTTLQAQLQTIQSNPESWTLISPILSSDPSSASSYPSQVRFFAASTLQLKIAREWDSLPEEQHELIKEQLLDWSSRSAASSHPRSSSPATVTSSSSLQDNVGERIVLRKLASALTSLSLRLFNHGWDDWLLHIITRLVAAGTSTEGVLQVLSVVIEQVARAELSGTKRSSYMGSLTSSTPMIVSTLSSSLSLPPSPTTFSEINSALQCFHSFLLASQFIHTDLDTLYPLILAHLHDPWTRSNAITQIEELIDRSSGTSSSVGISRYMSRIKTQHLLTEWACSSSVIDTIQQALVDQDTAMAYAEDDDFFSILRLLSTLGEHFISFLFSPLPPASNIPALTLQSPQVQTFLHLLITVTLYPGHSMEVYKINELTEGCWMALQEEASDVGLVFGEGEGREGRRGRELDWQVVGGVFRALLEGLRGRARRVDEGEYKGWTKDAKEDFRTYRSTNLSEVARYTYYTLREGMLDQLVELARSQIAFAPTSSDGYEDLEATLFLLYTIQEDVSIETSSPALSKLFDPEFIESLPTANHATLQTTALRLIGAYASWFSSSSSPDSELGNRKPSLLAAVTFIVGCLQQPQQGVTSWAARSLRLLCDQNRHEFRNHVASFVAVLSGLEGRIEDVELSKVLESVASVIQALPEEQIVEPLLGLATPIIHKLLESLSGAAPTADSREMTVQQLNYLTSCAKGLSDPEDDLYELDSSFDDNQQRHKDASSRLLCDPRIATLRQELSQAIEATCVLLAHDAEVVQALSDYIRATTCDSIVGPLSLDPFDLLRLTSRALSTSISSVWVSVQTSLLARQARTQLDAQLTADDLVNLSKPIEASLTTTLNHLSTPSSMSENPDLVSAFLSFNSSIIRHFPRVFLLLPQHLSTLLQFSILGLSLQERFSLKATLEVLISIVQQTRMASTSSELFAKVLEGHLRELIRALIESIAGKVPRSHLASLSEVYHALLIRYVTQTHMILHDLFTQDPQWPTPRAEEKVKDKFEKASKAARTGKQVRTAVNEFALVCRGLDGTVYGVESRECF
ncbi:BQ2448_6098 [Microbotryum intermedium]|uniref:BQ2448_6098 protein n=1 Tax=Microbotryum intermedium TaxID=269621 RepID=A0A238FR38_9BASI|nr:BQ2448_6098 [Microbotryum intermedium]